MHTVGERPRHLTTYRSRSFPTIVRSRAQNPPQIPRWCHKFNRDYASKIIQLQGGIRRICERDYLAKLLANDVSFHGGQLALRLQSNQSDVGLRVITDCLHGAGFQLAGKISSARSAKLQRQVEGEFREGTSEGPHGSVLTGKLRSRAEVPTKRPGRTPSSSVRGAQPPTAHGPLERPRRLTRPFTDPCNDR